jgi:hypothetical protein
MSSLYLMKQIYLIRKNDPFLLVDQIKIAVYRFLCHMRFLSSYFRTISIRLSKVSMTYDGDAASISSFVPFP